MAHGKNASQDKLKEWWGKRPLADYPVSNNPGINKYFKRYLHKIERKQGLKEIEQYDTA